MSAWDHFYNFWISQQTLPGNIFGDVLIGAATFIIGKYKIAPWLHARHKERLDQTERHHLEILHEHQKLFQLHEQQHQEVLAVARGEVPPAPTVVAPTAETLEDEPETADT
jgi:hypothetical protein